MEIGVVSQQTRNRIHIHDYLRIQNNRALFLSVCISLDIQGYSLKTKIVHLFKKVEDIETYYETAFGEKLHLMKPEEGNTFFRLSKWLQRVSSIEES